MNIVTTLISHNFVRGRGKQKVEYIVIHDTGNHKPLATAESHYRYFNGGNRQASAHYFVDEKEVRQLVKDEDTAWHVGDGKGQYGITNQNSIGIEICVNDGEYTTEIGKTVELTKYLMKKHNVPIDKVVRHYDASRKLCPNIMRKNNWELWFTFKRMLQTEIKIVKLNLRGKPLEFEGYLENGTNYVIINGKKEVLRTYLEGLGLVVTWDQGKQTVNAI